MLFLRTHITRKLIQGSVESYRATTSSANNYNESTLHYSIVQGW